MLDVFASQSDSVAAPSRHVAPLVPSDAADLPVAPKGIYLGTGGDLALIALGAPADAGATIFRNLPGGALLPVRARRVLATGTTATDLVALF